MYYPYLRARQFELIAIRELAIGGLSQKFVKPIFEPVKDSSNNLRIANEIFNEYGQTAYLIFNPLVGDLKNKSDDVLDFFIKLEDKSFLPAFHYRNNAKYISKIIDDNGLDNCMIICESETDAEDIDFQNLVTKLEVDRITIEDPERNRLLKRYLLGLGKKIIRLDDHFERQPRNSNFLEILAHRFCEEHIYYREDGYNGFSDYTIVPSEFTTGGSTPLAVAIHVSYLKGNDQIWIRHFTSVTNETQSNVQGKFAEAADKSVAFCRGNGLSNQAILELEKYYDDQHYPGLGTVKKIGIKNHILVVTSYLDSKN